MKYILTFLISLPLYSNTFRLKETGARFVLEISPDGVEYQSESFNKNILAKKCNETLIKNLNSELLASFQGLELKSGLSFEIDNIPFLIDPASEFSKTILMMDTRIQRFVLEEQTQCK